jgi:hypothetical protein
MAQTDIDDLVDLGPTNGLILGNALVSWRAIFAGLFVSLISYFILLALGLAIGGASLESAALGTGSASGIGGWTGVWMIISLVLSLFIGSFSASRVSGLIPIRVGRTQGVVITALFFLVILSQAASIVGLIGRGVGGAVGALGSAGADISQNPDVQDVLDDALGNLSLKSPPDIVAKGVAARLVRGDSAGARDYLARQSGLTADQADARISIVRAKVESVLRDTGAAAARVAKGTGWILFFGMILGIISASIGGTLGSVVNLRAPLSRADQRATRIHEAA